MATNLAAEPAALMQRAAVLAETGDLAQAERLCRAALAAQPNRTLGPLPVATAALLGACLALLPAAAAQKLFDELKIGGLAHDVTFFGSHVEGGADVNLEILFTSPDILRVIGSPRPHIG